MTDMTNLNDVKVGDKLLVTSHMGRSHVEVVAKVLKHYILSDKGIKYRKSSGDKIGGDGWYFSFARPITEEELAERRKKALEEQYINGLVCEISKVNFKTLSREKLEKIVSIINS